MHTCLYCNNKFSTKAVLLHHQKTAKYCLKTRDTSRGFKCTLCDKVLASNQRLNSHLETCRVKLDFKSMLKQKDELIAELKEQIKYLISRPTIENNIDNRRIQTKIQQINNFLPITEEHLLSQVNNLTLDHIMEGASGYARYAMDFPLKDRILCTDYARRKVMYKNEDGDIISDPNIVKLTKKLFTAIKDRNSLLIKEYSDRMKEELWGIPNEYGSELEGEESTNFQTRFGAVMDLVLKIMLQDRQVKELAEGERSELFQEFVKNVCSSCVSNKSQISGTITNDTTNN